MSSGRIANKIRESLFENAEKKIFGIKIQSGRNRN